MKPSWARSGVCATVAAAAALTVLACADTGTAAHPWAAPRTPALLHVLAPAGPSWVAVPFTARRAIAQIGKTTDVPLILPAGIPVATRGLAYATGAASRSRWEIDLATSPRCGGADSCFIASFEGHAGARLPAAPNARLSDGSSAVFQPSSCGGSCAPSSLWFQRAGVLYSWQIAGLPARTARRTTLGLASAAVAHGAR